MIIDFNHSKQQRFDRLAYQIMDQPIEYLSFDTVADFYQSIWLELFPLGTVWFVSGLDDGSFDEFLIEIQFKTQFLKIDIQQMKVTVIFKNMDGDVIQRILSF